MNDIPNRPGSGTKPKAKITKVNAKEAMVAYLASLKFGKTPGAIRSMSQAPARLGPPTTL